MFRRFSFIYSVRRTASIGLKKKEEQAEQDRLWNEHYRNPPTDADRVAADRIAAKLNLPRKMFWPRPLWLQTRGRKVRRNSS
jgi:hypothetical protein